jgi:hypothetical protein
MRIKAMRIKTRRRKGGVGTPDGTGPIGQASEDALSQIVKDTPTKALGRFARTSRRHHAAAARELQRRRPPWLDTEAPVPLDATVEIGIVPNFESFVLTHQEAQDILELNDDEVTTPQELQAKARDGRWRGACRAGLLDARSIPVRTVPFGRMYRAARHARMHGKSAAQVAQMLLEKYGVGNPCASVAAINRPRYDEAALQCNSNSQLWPVEMWALRRTIEVYKNALFSRGIRDQAIEAMGNPTWEPDFNDFDAIYELLTNERVESGPLSPLRGLVNFG